MAPRKRTTAGWRRSCLPLPRIPPRALGASAAPSASDSPRIDARRRAFYTVWTIVGAVLITAVVIYLLRLLSVTRRHRHLDGGYRVLPARPGELP